MTVARWLELFVAVSATFTAGFIMGAVLAKVPREPDDF